MSRYNNARILINGSEYYAPLRKSRKMPAIRQYATPILTNPTVEQRSRLKTTAYIWKYGDRFYNLAHKFYNDSRFWWVIAWYNSYPTEAHLETGNVIYIPLNIEQALRVLGQ